MSSPSQEAEGRLQAGLAGLLGMNGRLERFEPHDVERQSSSQRLLPPGYSPFQRLSDQPAFPEEIDEIDAPHVPFSDDAELSTRISEDYMDPVRSAPYELSTCQCP